MTKPKSHIHAERMLQEIAQYPLLTTSELTKRLNITPQECNNALRRLAGKLEITVISQRIRRFQVKPALAVNMVIPTRATPRESVFKSNGIYMGEKPTHRVSL